MSHPSKARSKKSESPATYDAAGLQAALAASPLGKPLKFLAKTGSTNEELVKWARFGKAPHGAACIADAQTAGRGRGEKSWESPPGVSVYASVVLRPSVSAQEAGLVPLVAALAVYDAVEAVRPCGARLKWPNDLLVDGRKLAGILCHLETDPRGKVDFMVVGVGLNVNTKELDLPPVLRSSATSLWLETHEATERGEVVKALFDALGHWYGRWTDGGTEAVLAAWRDRSDTLGRVVHIGVPGGEVVGVAEDIESDGALRVRPNASATDESGATTMAADALGGTLRVYAGEVQYVR